jgi:hypothetical protein
MLALRSCRVASSRDASPGRGTASSDLTYNSCATSLCRYIFHHVIALAVY